MRADDLAPLLATGRGDAVGFRTGTLVAFDPVTGANRIRVGGATLEDVPLLNTSELVGYRVGDTVALLRSKSAYFIAGRVLTPGEETLAQTAISTAGVYHGRDGLTIPTDWTTFGETVSELRVPVPRGYTKGHFQMTVSVGQTAASGGTCNVSVAPRAFGVTGPTINSGSSHIAVAQSFWASNFGDVGEGTAYEEIVFGCRTIRVGSAAAGEGNYHVAASVFFTR